MTEKQEKIIEAALQLFASEGYNATSTSKVAKVAGVSEGLIFRHFGNKEGLLKAILEQAENKLKLFFADIVMESEPMEVIRKAIQLPSLVGKSDFNFWKLQFKLKWELEINSDKKMEPLMMALTNAFKKLNYENPEQEALIIILFIEGIASVLLKGANFNPDEITSFYFKKYNH